VYKAVANVSDEGRKSQWHKDAIRLRLHEDRPPRRELSKRRCNKWATAIEETCKLLFPDTVLDAVPIEQETRKVLGLRRNIFTNPLIEVWAIRMLIAFLRECGGFRAG
jgi:hypothetical protein